MGGKEKSIILLYTVLGILLAIIGFYVIWAANIGVLGGESYLRYGVMGIGIFLVVIGSHLAIVGVNSLRSS